MSDKRDPLDYAIDWMEQQADRASMRPSPIRAEIGKRQKAAADAIRELREERDYWQNETDAAINGSLKQSHRIRELEHELAAVTKERDELRAECEQLREDFSQRLLPPPRPHPSGRWRPQWQANSMVERMEGNE